MVGTTLLGGVAVAAAAAPALLPLRYALRMGITGTTWTLSLRWTRTVWAGLAAAFPLCITGGTAPWAAAATA